MKKILSLVVAGCALLAPVSSLAQDSGKPGRGQMVQRLEAACQGKSEGAACSFARANGNSANGSCVNESVRSQDMLVCLTPQMMKRLNQRGGNSSSGQ